MFPQKQASIRDLGMKKSSTMLNKISGEDASPMKNIMKPSMIFKIKSYLNDAVTGELEEPQATKKSGYPTGNLSVIEMENLKEMKKRFKLRDLTQSNKLNKTGSKKDKIVAKNSPRPTSPTKKNNLKS